MPCLEVTKTKIMYTIKTIQAPATPKKTCKPTHNLNDQWSQHNYTTVQKVGLQYLVASYSHCVLI